MTAVRVPPRGRSGRRHGRAENRADFIAVREIGVHLVQGGLFAAPMPAKKFAQTVLARETSPR